MCAGNNWSIIVKSYQDHFYSSTLPLTTAEELQEFGVGAVFSVQFAELKKNVDFLEYLVQIMVIWIKSRYVHWFEMSSHTRFFDVHDFGYWASLNKDIVRINN